MNAQHKDMETPLAGQRDSAARSQVKIEPADTGVASSRTEQLHADRYEAHRPLGALLAARARRLLGRRPAPQQLDVLEGYARWAATYEQDMNGHPLALAETEAMRALLPSCEGIVALDAACGTGRYARLLAHQGAQQVIGVDQSLPMLKLAQAQTVPEPGTKIQFICGSLLHLPLPDESCDLAIVALALTHLRPAQLYQAFGELSRVLKPGGILLMSEMHPFGALTGGRCRCEQYKGKHQQVYHIQTYTHLHEDYLAAALGADLTLEALREPRLTDNLFPAFEHAGMADFARQFAGFPLALVCRWRKAS